MATPRPISKQSEPSDQRGALTRTGADAGGAQAETVSPHLDARPDAGARYDFLAPPQAPEEIGRLGPYAVLGLIGAGGMGMVFRAADPELGRQVALKVILPAHATRPHARERFLREARAVAAVEHLHVVPIFHVGEDRGVPYLVMPLLKGESLAQALKRDPRPPLPELVRIGREIAEGLAAAHAQHLIHRDIKPGNVWLEGTGRWVRLLDFGLARPDAPMAVLEESLTASGQFVGTPVYMSPEQAHGKGITSASDLFSLGVVLYQMATGVLPFAGPTTMAVLTALATRDPDPPTELAPALPPTLEVLIMQLLAKDPANRPPSAQAVADAVRQIEATLPPVTQTPAAPATTGVATASPTMTAIAPRPPRRRRPMLWAAAGLLLLVGAGFLAQHQIRIATAKGTLVIDADDPNVEIVVKKNGAVIRDKTRDREIVLKVGDYTIELSEKKDGLKLSTDRFSITRDGTETVKVWLEKTPPEPLPADLQRKVAEWVLKQDGGWTHVRLSTGSSMLVRPGDAIPKDFAANAELNLLLPNPETLTAQAAAWLRAMPADCHVNIGLCTGDWNDAALGRLIAQVQGLPNLRLHIRAPAAVTDQGLKHLFKLPGLWGIYLVDLKVSDAAIRELDKLPRLASLGFSGVPITDETIAALLQRGTCHDLVLENTRATKTCFLVILKNKNLIELRLRGIPLREDDLRRLAELKKLLVFELWGPFITNASVRQLEPLPTLIELRIIKCEQVDDAVFDHLPRLGSVTDLWLHDNAKITDAGLTRVKDMPKLQRLYVHESPGITAAGVAKLRAALPKLTVVWDGDAKK